MWGWSINCERHAVTSGWMNKVKPWTKCFKLTNWVCSQILKHSKHSLACQMTTKKHVNQTIHTHSKHANTSVFPGVFCISNPSPATLLFCYFSHYFLPPSGNILYNAVAILISVQVGRCRIWTAVVAMLVITQKYGNVALTTFFTA